MKTNAFFLIKLVNQTKACKSVLYFTIEINFVYHGGIVFVKISFQLYFVLITDNFQFVLLHFKI